MTDEATAQLTQSTELVDNPQIQTCPVKESITRLRQLTQLDVQSSWRCWSGSSIPEADSAWLSVELNSRGHVAWDAGMLWLEQQLVIPQAIQGYPVAGKVIRLALRWWAEQAQIFVNQRLVQEGDLFDCAARILLQATPGEILTVRLRLVSPGHDAGALVHSCLMFESEDQQVHPDPGFVADELAVLQGYLERFQPEKLEELAKAVKFIDWSALDNPGQFEQSLLTLRQSLQPIGNWLKQRRVLLLGHAHLDLAWLWPVSETWEVAERTFQSALDLQRDFPELIFCHSTPALYAWLEQHRPGLFAAIQSQVAAGRWEVVAGLWIEPELNLVSGESLVRQVLYGQLYVQAKFGAVNSIAWLPDSFGFCWQLPQILKQGGVEYFVTQKLRWNDTTQFPYEVFWWRSPDGSQILSVMSSLIGEAIEPVKMAAYAQNWEAQTGATDALWLPGVGDHGGGPTRDMLETAQQWQHSPLFPRLEFSTAQAFLHNLEAQLPQIPVWTDELYLEFHRGCYTTHAEQKRWNRRCEQLLYQAELFASVRSLVTGAAYPKAELEAAWKLVLFNQFHDILPGSAIPEVFSDANRDWATAEQMGRQILETAQSAIAAQIALPPPPHPDSRAIVVFNSLNWSRSEIVRLPLNLDLDQHWQVQDLEGNLVPSQIQPDLLELLFFATPVPAVGYQVFWLTPTSARPARQTPDRFILENECLHVEVDSDTGDLAQVFDKIHQRQVLSRPGNQLQFFRDSGQYWDAWNIDPNYAQHPLPAARLRSIQWLSSGPLEYRLRVVREFGSSQFCQDYILETGSDVLKIATAVDWQERQVLVKAAFPLTVQASYATYEIPCGAIQRPTLPNPQLQPHEQAKWEVPALQWADLSNTSEAYGVSLLNDCKYGYDAQPDQLRLTLLRSPNWPDPNADRGLHQFTYALYPHGGSWQAHTPQRGYELNQPLQAVLLDRTSKAQAGQLPPGGQFINLQARNLILMAFKQAEADPQQWILRCYECCGETARLELQSDLGLAIAQPIDLLEHPTSIPNKETNEIAPWKIASFIVNPSITPHG